MINMVTSFISKLCVKQALSSDSIACLSRGMSIISIKQGREKQRPSLTWPLNFGLGP